jgi:hypothetical protein
MPITAQFDPEAQAMYVRLRDAKVARSIEVDDDYVVDLGADGEVLGVEVLAPPMSGPDLLRLAERFDLLDHVREIWQEVQRAQPATPTRSGIFVSYTLEIPSLLPAVAGASSARLEVDSHEYALGG